jgi:phosphate transport system permease protein
MTVSSTRASARVTPGRASSARRRGDRIGDMVLRVLCVIASLAAVVVLVEIAYQVITGAHLAISKFGLGFLGHVDWAPNKGVFGAASFLFGTAVSSAMALVIATPLGIAIGLYLSQLASGRLRAVIGPLVEMLAAIPSVILGFWGILILAPWVQKHLEPWLHSVFGFLPIFGPQQTTGASVFTAGLVLAIMVLPIIASISRDLFLTVPRELQEGATALGATRWEVIRGVVLPSAASGVVAAAFLGLGRALGEAIAVAQTIGGGNAIHASLFQTGDTLAGRLANEFQGAFSKLHFASLFYLATILLAIGIVTNLIAQWIGRRFDVRAGVAR